MCLVNDSYALHHRYAMYCDLESANRDAQSLKIFGPRPWKNRSEFARYSAVPTDPCPRPILKSAFMKRLSVSCILSFGCCVRWFNNKILLLLPKKTQDFTTRDFVKNLFIQLFLCDGFMRFSVMGGSQARVKGESVLFLGWRALFSWWIPFGLMRLSGINPGGSSSVGGSKMYVNNLP